MKNADVHVGHVYEMRVSGRLVPVAIVREVDRHVRLYHRASAGPAYGFRKATKYFARNLRTGRDLPNPVSAARCRKHLGKISGGTK